MLGSVARRSINKAAEEKAQLRVSAARDASSHSVAGRLPTELVKGQPIIYRCAMLLGDDAGIAGAPLPDGRYSLDDKVGPPSPPMAHLEIFLEKFEQNRGNAKWGGGPGKNPWRRKPAGHETRK